mmetsp:Transcript_24908/g.58040  ORF Transcript_24908/g.58040 Transcript_24908/m.58040 type:complete len:412 (-) Transcript_24908:731-1966(-)
MARVRVSRAHTKKCDEKANYDDAVTQEAAERFDRRASDVDTCRAGAKRAGACGRRRALPKEALEVSLGDAADRVDVRRRAVVLGHVPTQRFVDVGRAENEQEAVTAANPWQQLREHIREHHARARLDVLQSEVFGDGAAVLLEGRLLVGHRTEHSEHAGDHRVDDRRRVVSAQLRCELCGAVARLRGRLGSAHEGRVQDEAAQLFRVGGNPIDWLPRDAARVSEDLLIARRDSGHHLLAHDADERGSARRVGAARERQEESAGRRAAQVVPQVRGGAQRDLLFCEVQPCRLRTGRHLKRRTVSQLAPLDSSGVGGVGVGARLLGAAQDARRDGKRARVDARVARGARCLLGARDEGGAVRADGLHVHRGREHLHVAQAELRALREHLAVEHDERATVVVKAASVAAALVGV